MTPLVSATWVELCPFPTTHLCWVNGTTDSKGSVSLNETWLTAAENPAPGLRPDTRPQPGCLGSAQFCRRGPAHRHARHGIWCPPEGGPGRTAPHRPPWWAPPDTTRPGRSGWWWTRRWRAATRRPGLTGRECNVDPQKQRCKNTKKNRKMQKKKHAQKCANKSKKKQDAFASCSPAGLWHHSSERFLLVSKEFFPSARTRSPELAPVVENRFQSL